MEDEGVWPSHQYGEDPRPPYPPASSIDTDSEYRRKLVKKIRELATLVATATYTAGFNPPGGVWQDIHDATGQHLLGDPIMRSTHLPLYVLFFYSNATAFISSLTVVVLTLLVTANNPKISRFLQNRIPGSSVILMNTVITLMMVAMLALAAAYGVGACQDKVMVVWYCLLVPGTLAFVGQSFIRKAAPRKEDEEEKNEERDFRKLMVRLSMFAVTITYVAGLSTPGGFWDSAEGGHRPGDAILKDRQHGRTLRGFLLSNTLAFAASLFSVSVVMRKKTLVVGSRAPVSIIVGVLSLLGGLLAAYISGSSRGRSGITWLSGAALAYVVLHVAVHLTVTKLIEPFRIIMRMMRMETDESRAPDPRLMRMETDESRDQHKLVQLMAGLAVAITYQAGLYPPGGLWAANADGHTAGDPILLAINARRYKGFHYCNSVSFVASLLVMFLAQKKEFNKHHALEAAMMLDMLGLIGAYAIGSSRDQVTTLYVLGLAGAAVIYVVIHISYFTMGDVMGPRYIGEIETSSEYEKRYEVEKMGKGFLFFAILVASITYQAGLTPPGGFLLKDDDQSGHHAGDPVLHYNYPRRYRTFLYCNSVSFMLSIVLILLLVNPNLYKPAIRSHALSICSAVSYVCLMGAFAAGCTQHMKGSIYIFVSAASSLYFVSIFVVILVYLGKMHMNDKLYNVGVAARDAPPAPATTRCSVITEIETNKGPVGEMGEENEIEDMGLGEGQKEEDAISAIEKESERKRKGRERKRKELERISKTRRYVYLITLAVLVASATYPAGLDPPGGSWQSSSDGHDAGNPMMHDNRRQRYFAFFVGNTISFMASTMLIHMLLSSMLRLPLPKPLKEMALLKLYRKGINGLVTLQCLGFLVAYAAGSSRQWKTSVYTGALLIPVMAFVGIHVGLWSCREKRLEAEKKRLKALAGGGEEAGGGATP